MSDWIDVTVGLRDGMVCWPGDPSPNFRRISDMDGGEVCNVTFVSMTAHTGTHMDAPLHFISGGMSIDQMPLAATAGEARVVQIDDPRAISRDELIRHQPQRGERLLFKTANSERSWKTDEFQKQFVHINAGAAQYLVECGVQTVGVDYLSIGAYEGDGVETHKILLGAGVWAIEGLNLSNVDPGRYEMVCLPLKLMGADGAPARAMLRKLQ